MRNRIMRTIVLFDLPTLSYTDQKNYRKFHKFLINEGFIQMQESVYSKICLNLGQNGFLCERIRKNAPNSGLIQVLTITEKQYSNIELIVGEKQTKVIDSTDRVIVL